MLMNRIRDTYREMTGQFTPIEPVTEVQANRPAANASNFANTGKQARRQRRLRGLVRTPGYRSIGWTVRTW